MYLPPAHGLLFLHTGYCPSAIGHASGHTSGHAVRRFTFFGSTLAQMKNAAKKMGMLLRLNGLRLFGLRKRHVGSSVKISGAVEYGKAARAVTPE